MDAPAKRKWPIVVGAVLGALILVVVIGLFVLDSLLTSMAHDEAAKLSQQLGRPVSTLVETDPMVTGRPSCCDSFAASSCALLVRRESSPNSPMTTTRISAPRTAPTTSGHY